MEWINQAREVFGNKIAFLFIAGLVAYSLLAFTPFLIPAWRAFSKRDRLPRPWLFIIVVGGLAYGWSEFLITLISLPGAVFLTYFAPSLREADLLRDSWLLSALDGFLKWWWVAMPFALFAAAVVVTKWLGNKWRWICGAQSA